MIQISFYQIENTPIEKTATQLIEKCYHAGMRCTVLMSNSEFCEHLNKHLWTYSQKQFIPHGSKLDPLPEIQPIYLAITLENINNSTAAIMVNCNVEMMRNVFKDLKELKKLAFERLILIFSLDDNPLEAELKIIKQDLLNSQINFDYFKQNASGWTSESN